MREEPLDLGDGFLYSYDYLIADSSDALYSPEYWGGPGGYAIRERIDADSPRRGDCVAGHVVSYLQDGTLPSKGTVCPANPNPFLPAKALRKSGPQLPMIGLPPLRAHAR